jgi:hypothetical protein
VVAGNAPAPTRHDTSIPEPLASVTMTALQSSDRARFKDASEAEQALREAWDRCLTQGLVHPAVLAMEEMPHDKVPPRMHEPRGGIARPMAPIHGSDSGELTAIDEKMLARPLAIESSKPRVGDDDPTVLSARGDRPSGKARALEPERVYPDGSGAREAPRTEKDPSKIVPAAGGRTGSGERLQPKLPLVIVVAMVVIAVVICALFLGGVLKL